MYPVITISREFYSGGRSIGSRVAENLGIPFIDKDFIRKAAEKTGFSMSDVEKQGENISYLEKYFTSSFYNGLPLADDQDKIYSAQKQIILEYAKKGSCVIVGRCADYILAEAGIQSLNIFIHADPDIRKENFLRANGPQTRPVEKIIAKKDKGRAMYHRYYTDREWGQAKNYHLCLDSGFLGNEYCVELITETAKKMSR